MGVKNRNKSLALREFLVTVKGPSGAIDQIRVTARSSSRAKLLAVGKSGLGAKALKAVPA